MSLDPGNRQNELTANEGETTFLCKRECCESSIIFSSAEIDVHSFLSIESSDLVSLFRLPFVPLEDCQCEPQTESRGCEQNVGAQEAREQCENT